MICAIATPSAQSAYNATKDSDIPVVYTAVTSPKAAGFVDKEGKNVGNITGTSDLVLADKQLKLIRQMMPKAKNVGIFYSTNEANSKAGIEAYEKVADKYGFKIITQGITASADMPMAADSLLKKVDCITNLTDNLVVSNMQTYLQKANKLNIPVFGSEVEQVKLGCVACVGIDFVKLGKQTGKMAAKILKGEEKATYTLKITRECDSDVYALFTQDKFKAKDGTEIEYNLYVPSDYDASKKYPVVFVLHGGGQRTQPTDMILKRYQMATVFAKDSEKGINQVYCNCSSYG